MEKKLGNKQQVKAGMFHGVLLRILSSESLFLGIHCTQLNAPSLLQRNPLKDFMY